MVNVPTAYQQYVQQAATATGLPFNVVAAQAQAESGFNSQAVSSTGAEGWLQFEPATYNAYAGQAGVSPGTEFNVADETKVYVVFMDKLLKDEGGNVFKALEAYNAGEGNLGAGSSYASGILQNAGVPTAQLTSDTIKIPGGGLPVIGPVIGAINGGVSFATDPAGTILNDLTSGILKVFGIGSVKDLFQRLGLILLGVGLIFVGIRVLSQGSHKTVVNISQPKGNTESETETVTAPKTKALSPVSSGEAEGGESLGASEAIESAVAA